MTINPAMSMNSLPKPLSTYYDHAHGIGITYSDHAHRIGITYSDHARRPRLLCNSLLRRPRLLCNSLLLGPAFYVFTQNKTPTTGAKLGSVEKKMGPQYMVTIKYLKKVTLQAVDSFCNCKNSSVTIFRIYF